jgi:hypothetical protein
MNKLYLPIIILVLVVLGYFSWTYIQTTPQYSLYQMYQAVAAHDYPTFTKYADVDSIVGTLVNNAIDKSNQQTSGGGLIQLGKSLIFKLAENMKPTLINATKVAIKKGVEAGDIKSVYKPQNVLMTLLELKVEQEGNLATIYVVKNNKIVTAFKMRQMEGYWQVYEMTLDVK